MTLYNKPNLAKDAKIIEGYYDEDKDYKYDIKGYFLIRINKEKKVIEIGHCRKSNIIDVLITGKKPQDLYWAAIQQGLISSLDHAAYLGKELTKAYIALKENREYIQDEDLK